MITKLGIGHFFLSFWLLRFNTLLALKNIFFKLVFQIMMKFRRFNEMGTAIWTCKTSNIYPLCNARLTHPFLAGLTFNWIKNYVFAKTYKLIFNDLLSLF
jgi:hypothetical protein